MIYDSDHDLQDVNTFRNLKSSWSKPSTGLVTKKPLLGVG